MKSPVVILLTLTAVLITQPAFAVNRVLSLDGDGDYVEMADSESLNDIGSQMTMEVWIKATAFPDQWIPIIRKSDDSRQGEMSPIAKLIDHAIKGRELPNKDDTTIDDTLQQTILRCS